MQLFSVGLFELNTDGTVQRDTTGEPVATYETKAIMSFARAWTGLTRQRPRRNIELTQAGSNENNVDMMAIEPTWRDALPKMSLHLGYIGDHDPLCSALPPAHFLRKAASFRYLGHHAAPVYYVDPASFAESARHVELNGASSALYLQLCDRAGESGPCRFPSRVTLDANLPCDGSECGVQSVRVVKLTDAVSDETVWYEYVPPSCTHYAFFSDAKFVATDGDSAWPTTETGGVRACANPLAAAAGATCCDNGGGGLVSSCAYVGERLTFAAADAKCAGLGLALCSARGAISNDTCGYNAIHTWLSAQCTVQVQVHNDARVSLVHTDSAVPSTMLDSGHAFRVRWEGGHFPTVDDNCAGASGCMHHGQTCLCNVDIDHSPVFTSTDVMPTAEQVEASLHVGAPDPESFDAGTYVLHATAGGVSAFTKKGGTGDAFDQNTIFHIVVNGTREIYLANTISTVRLRGSAYTFRNPVAYTFGTDPSAGAAQHETDWVLRHLYIGTPSSNAQHPWLLCDVTAMPALWRGGPRSLCGVADHACSAAAVGALTWARASAFAGFTTRTRRPSSRTSSFSASLPATRRRATCRRSPRPSTTEHTTASALACTGTSRQASQRSCSTARRDRPPSTWTLRTAGCVSRC